MCHAVRVKLSPAEAKEARKLYGVMVPVYASIALIFLAAVLLSSVPRSGDAVAFANDTAMSLASADRTDAPH